MNLDFLTTPRRFSKLGTLYITALTIIALVAIAGQVLIQRHLKSQLSDSRVINIAGTQRYKSQWIVKMSILVCKDIEHNFYPDRLKTLEDLLAQWKKGHEGLQQGDSELMLPGNNSEEVTAMFADLEPFFQRVYTSTREILLAAKDSSASVDINRSLTTLLENEAVFLEKMDRIVFQYDQEARQKVSVLRTLEYVLLAISIVVIVLEIVFVFRPTAIQVSKTIDQLMASEQNAKKLSKEIGALYTSLEKTYEQLSIVNQPVDNPRLYAKADRGGNVTFVSDVLRDLCYSEPPARALLADLFPGMAEPGDWMDNVVDTVSDGETWLGEVRFEGPARRTCWVSLTITPVYNELNEVDELMVMGADITLRKEAEQNMNVKNRAEIEKKINQQKLRSVLILEGQEEERKRIAMDIHDGIGQMLTSLKYQIESINLRDSAQAGQKIQEVAQLIKEVIREVRKVTFNLKPTVLGDFGLQAALNVFVQEIGKLTDTRLVYNSSSDIERLPQKIENNIFRIIQEAINNAIKYSGADTIYVDVNQSNHELVITVRDEGKGFNPDLVEARNMNIESGRGFFNMYERTEYVNGHLHIESQPGKGTTVSLTVPVKTTITQE